MNLEGAQLLENPTHIATCGEIAFAGVSPHYFACPPTEIKEPTSTEIKEPSFAPTKKHLISNLNLISFLIINFDSSAIIENTNIKITIQ